MSEKATLSTELCLQILKIVPTRTLSHGSVRQWQIRSASNRNTIVLAEFPYIPGGLFRVENAWSSFSITCQTQFYDSQACTASKPPWYCQPLLRRRPLTFLNPTSHPARLLTRGFQRVISPRCH